MKKNRNLEILILCVILLLCASCKTKKETNTFSNYKTENKSLYTYKINVRPDSSSIQLYKIDDEGNKYNILSRYDVKITELTPELFLVLTVSYPDSKLEIFDANIGTVHELGVSSSTVFISNDKLYVLYGKNKSQPYLLSLYSIEDFNWVKEINLSEFIQNDCYFTKNPRCKITQEGNVISISYYDLYDELFERIFLDLDSFIIKREEIVYSKYVRDDELEKIEEIRNKIPSKH